MTAWVLLTVFLLLLALGLPVSFALLASAGVALITALDAPTAMTVVSQRMAVSLDSFPLLALPLFILAGTIMHHGGISEKLLRLSRALVGGMPGSLAYVNVVACMLFGAISGSAVAAIAAMGGVLAPQMLKAGYDRNFSASVNVCSGTTGLIIPPSNILIVYSLASGGVSIGALFVAGYMPGLLMGLAILGTAAVIARREKYPSAERASVRELLAAILDALPSLFLIVLVVGGILAGFFTATEASAIAVLYALVLATVVYKALTLKALRQVLLHAAEMTGVVLLLVATSMAMSWVLSFVNLPQEISATLLSLSENPLVILLIINLLLLAVGSIMDMTPAVLIFTPIFLPVAVELGLDPVHFGIVMVTNLCIGLCTPPVGTALFVGATVGQTEIAPLVRRILPFYAAMIVVLILVTFFPQITLILPRLLGY